MISLARVESAKALLRAGVDGHLDQTCHDVLMPNWNIAAWSNGVPLTTSTDVSTLTVSGMCVSGKIVSLAWKGHCQHLAVLSQC